MERREEEVIRVSEPESMVSITLGRVMSTLLTARPRKLQESISRFSPDSRNKSSLSSVEESLWFLHKYVADAVEREEEMEEFLIPMIENTIRFKESKHGGQSLILLNWLFQDELLFEAVTRNLCDIIAKKDDRYIALGWCMFVRELTESEPTADHYSLNGLKEKYVLLVKMLSSCIPHLLVILSRNNILQDGNEYPSRLSVSAADCVISLTGALAKEYKAPTSRLNAANLNESNQSVSLVPSDDEKRKRPAPISDVLNSKLKYLLWNHLPELISLVQSLFAWNRRSRPLHAKGLNQVLKRLQRMESHHRGCQDGAGSNFVEDGTQLLSSCWKHYSVLLHLEDPKLSKRSKELIEQYLSGLKYYSEQHPVGDPDKKNAGIETRKFFLTCLCLLLGRLDGRKLESLVSEYGMQLVHSLLAQLRCDDEDIVDGGVSIIKAAIFKPHSSSESSFTDTRQMDAMLSSLFHLLDERDGTAKAVVMLVAEYCSISADDHCLKEVLTRLASKNVMQRKNAIDVISELIRISNDSAVIHSRMPWKEIAQCLLERLGDEETAICQCTSNLLKSFEPTLVLPGLVKFVYSSNGRIQSFATQSVLGVLRHHKEDSEVICMLLGCVSNAEIPDAPVAASQSGEGSKLDKDRILRLIPEWAKTVQNWNSLVGPFIDKMFNEPANATMVRFLSCINEHLADAADVVLHRVLSRIKGQEDMDESFLLNHENDDSKGIEVSLFDRLCPLLILRLLPLRVFNDLDSTMMYSQTLKESNMKGSHFTVVRKVDHECIADFLLIRAFSKFEFEDVRKLSAELCGRIHPQVLFPIVCAYLKEAAGSRDILRIKACLFSICTSLAVRGLESVSYLTACKIRDVLEIILLWPSSNGDEISKAQHGCIDCLALMVCAELQAAEPSKVSNRAKPDIAASRDSAFTYVVQCLVQNKSETPVPVPFRLCMANVLISVSQKISSSGKKPFARKVLSSLIQSIKTITHPEVRAACLQVLFSAVYHLKSALLPYSSDLLRLSLWFLEQGSEQEKLAGAKLMASLMASEDAILESISGGLLEAASVLAKLASADPSSDVREVCGKLLACITSS